MAYHSLTFGTGSQTVNTWNDWHLVPDERPTISPPGVKTSYVDVPGMDGSLDYTEALGDLKYELRDGSWSFYVMNDYEDPDFPFNSWNELYLKILEKLHGRYIQIWSEDDPDYVYYGRIEVSNWDPLPGHSKVTLDYKIDPYKYKAKVNPDGTVDRDDVNSTSGIDWKWDELFDVEILYGKFDVDELKVRNLYWNGTNPDEGEDTLEISITTTTKMKVEFDGETYNLMSGRNKYSGIKLHEGDNILVFIGNGQVTVDYDKEGVSL